MEKKEKPYRGWVYGEKGDYHRNLDPNWSYTPTYKRKMSEVKKIIGSFEKNANILDVGCGEGVLVEEYSQHGWNIKGLDLNYESEFVQRGNLLSMPFDDQAFDLVLLLDVFEHLQYSEQPLALREIKRVMKPNGLLIATIPNLAHLNSRTSFIFKGKLDRTDVETNHIGERPYIENVNILENSGFNIVSKKGITLTIPWLYRKVICRKPAQFRWLHDLLEPFAIPSLAMLNLFTCRLQDDN